MNLLASIAQEVNASIYSDRCRLVLSSPDPFSRSSAEGHITASGLVLRGNTVLLVFHPFIKRWFQPGGHIDGGEKPIDAAIREVYEETGLICAPYSQNLEPIDIDVHEIPDNPKKGERSHLHIDLLYRLQVLREDLPQEDISCDWVRFDQVQSARIQRALSKLNT